MQTRVLYSGFQFINGKYQPTEKFIFLNGKIAEKIILELSGNEWVTRTEFRWN